MCFYEALRVCCVLIVLEVDAVKLICAPCDDHNASICVIPPYSTSTVDTVGLVFNTRSKRETKLRFVDQTILLKPTFSNEQLLRCLSLNSNEDQCYILYMLTIMTRDAPTPYFRAKTTFVFSHLRQSQRFPCIRYN